MIKSARRSRDRWNKGRTELDNIDSRWSKITDAYFYLPTDDVLLIPRGQCDFHDGPGGSYSIQAPVIPYDHTCIDGTLYEIRIVHYIKLIGTKNDGLVTPESCVWDSGSSLSNNPKNQYYDDVPDEGGYNHFEIKRYKRAYTLPGVFNKGDYAPPMKQAADWIYFGYQNQ